MGTRRGERLRFDGWIIGTGTTSGTRLVVGHWPRSPLGPVSDVMVQRPDGHRVLLAQSAELAEFVAATYTFDEVRVVDVAVRRPDDGTWEVLAGPLALELHSGRRPALGRLLRAVPAPLARTPGWVRLLDPPARLLTGLRTTGSAGNGRTEWYGVQDLHAVTAVRATWDGEPLGSVAPVQPPVTFGFGSVPPAPSVVRVTTTVAVPRDPSPGERAGSPRGTIPRGEQPGPVSAVEQEKERR
ncbi:hypothetical protein [Modestobacter sp. SYSU DS0511]